MHKQSKWVWFALSLVVIGLDQLTKVLALSWLAPGQPHDVLPVLNFTLAFNRGAAFSFLSAAGGWQRYLFLGLALVAVAGLSAWILQSKPCERLQLCALGLILGGAIGNAWDRAVRHVVVDFIQVHYQQWTFPIFNVADCAITVGVIFLMWVMLKSES